MKKILTIQSHVASGYVGNKTASFVIQRYGHEVIQINSLQFSNHTGYQNGFSGDAFSEKHLLSVFDGLKKNNLLDDVNYGITGYLGDKNSAEAIYLIISEMKKNNKDFIYFCDPVMGDDFTRCFIKPEVKELVCNKLINLADVVKANHTEAQFLFGREINSEDDAMELYNMLLEKTKNPNLILVISSFMRGKPNNNDEKIKTLMIKNHEKFFVETPLLKLNPLTCGTGDLVTSLFASCLVDGINEKDALVHTINATYEILKYTVEKGSPEIELISMQNHIKLEKNLGKTSAAIELTSMQNHNETAQLNAGT